MIVYESTKDCFIKDVIENTIANRIENLYKMRIGKNVNKREIGARTLTVHLGLNRSASDLKLYNYS